MKIAFHEVEFCGVESRVVKVPRVHPLVCPVYASRYKEKERQHSRLFLVLNPFDCLDCSGLGYYCHCIFHLGIHLRFPFFGGLFISSEIDSAVRAGKKEEKR